jgi:hypothetical protein
MIPSKGPLAPEPNAELPLGDVMTAALRNVHARFREEYRKAKEAEQQAIRDAYTNHENLTDHYWQTAFNAKARLDTAEAILKVFGIEPLP